MTDLQLVTRAAQKAETAIGGTGGFAGTAKSSANVELSNKPGQWKMFKGGEEINLAQFILNFFE